MNLKPWIYQLFQGLHINICILADVNRCLGKFREKEIIAHICDSNLSINTCDIHYFYAENRRIDLNLAIYENDQFEPFCASEKWNLNSFKPIRWTVYFYLSISLSLSRSQKQISFTLEITFSVLITKRQQRQIKCITLESRFYQFFFLFIERIYANRWNSSVDGRIFKWQCCRLCDNS